MTRSASRSPSPSPRSSLKSSPSSSQSPSLAPKYNEIFLYLGDWGRWQRTVFFLVSAPIIFTAVHTYLNSFTAAVAEHRCLIRGLDEVGGRNYYNRSEEIADLNRFIPKTEDGKFHQCERFFETNSSFNNGSVRRGSCPDGWVFNHDTFGVTIIEKLKLVCHKDHLRKLLQVATMVGMLIGAITFGQISDSFGRQTTLMVSLLLQTAVAIGTAFSPNFGTYLVLRCLVGAFSSGVFNTAFCLAMECVGPSQRTWVGIGVEIFWAAGTMMLAGFAFLLPNFEHLQLAMSLPLILFMPYFWIVPESPRWLLLHGYYDRFRSLMISAARTNGIRISEKVLEQYTPHSSPAVSRPDTPPECRANEKWFKDEKYVTETTQEEEDEERLYLSEAIPLPSAKPKGLAYMFTRPLLVLKTANVLFNWFVNTLIYYGLTMNSTNLNVNPHLSLCISGAVEIPAYIFCIMVLNRLGRKPVLVFVLLVCGVTLFTSIFIPPSNTLLLTIQSMVGKCAISASFAIIYVFSAELFPTVVRNVAMGLCAMVARFGGIVAPVIADMGSSDALGNKDPTYPLAIFGCFAFVAGILATCLPETMDKMLPETIEDFEEEGLVNPFRCFRRRKVFDDKLADFESRGCGDSMGHCLGLIIRPCGFGQDGKEQNPFKRTIALCSDIKNAKRDSITTYEPARIPTQDENCLEVAGENRPEKKEDGAPAAASKTSVLAASSTALERRHTVSGKNSTPKLQRCDDATFNRGNAMLQAAVSMTFSVHSFHNSEVEVYPVHPRVVETSFRERAASVATEFRVRVNSVTQMKNGGEGGEEGRGRSATVNGTLIAEGNIKTPRFLPSVTRITEPRSRSHSLFGNARAKDLRKMSVDELEEEGSGSSSASTANASPKPENEGQDTAATNFYLDVSDDDVDGDGNDATDTEDQICTQLNSSNNHPHNINNNNDDNEDDEKSNGGEIDAVRDDVFDKL